MKYAPTMTVQSTICGAKSYTVFAVSVATRMKNAISTGIITTTKSIINKIPMISPSQTLHLYVSIYLYACVYTYIYVFVGLFVSANFNLIQTSYAVETRVS